MRCRIEKTLMNRTTLIVTLGLIAWWAGLPGAPAEASPAKKPASTSAAPLPKPPARIADAAEQAQACIECHEETANLLEGDKHIASDFHCVVCHGESKAHLELEEEGTPPDRAWRHWIEEENRFEWRMKNASFEIAKFCASCHGRKPPEAKVVKTVHWDKYLETGHGLAVCEGNHDAPTCTDCHYAHGAGCEPLTDETVVQRCSVCHADKEMMERVGLDLNVMEEFESRTHGDMGTASAEKRKSCIKCHYPH